MRKKWVGTPGKAWHTHQSKDARSSPAGWTQVQISRKIHEKNELVLSKKIIPTNVHTLSDTLARDICPYIYRYIHDYLIEQNNPFERRLYSIELSVKLKNHLELYQICTRFNLRNGREF